MHSLRGQIKDEPCACGGRVWVSFRQTRPVHHWRVVSVSVPSTDGGWIAYCQVSTIGGDLFLRYRIKRHERADRLAHFLATEDLVGPLLN